VNPGAASPAGAAGDRTGPGGDDRELTDRVLGVLRDGGLVAGVAAAEVFDGTRHDLEVRKRAGLHGGMAFTYRNPARSTDPSRSLDGARSLVVGALGYLRDPPPADPDAVALGRVARYAWSDAYRELTDRLGRGASVLRADGYRSAVVADQNALVDREAAHRAGLGWYGRNANLLLPGRGSWYVLGTIVTDAPLVASPAPRGGCGACTRCVTGCPTGAIVAPGVVDARRCLAWMLQDTGVFPRPFREALGDRIYGCDDCQEVCPPNRAAGAGPAAETDRAGVDVVDLLADDDERVIAAAGRWYVPRRQARYLRRNALVVLGNAADPGDGRAVAAVVRCLDHPDPLVRAHAVWAAARLGRPELADRLEDTEADPIVRLELALRGEVTPRA
jgi:epoxyqueuosine reductase